MAKDFKKQAYKPPFEKRAKKFILDMLFYPKKVFNKYKSYNGAIGELFIVTENKSLHGLRVKNAKLINIFIILPLFLGVMAMVWFTFQYRYQFVLYYNHLTSPLMALGFFKTISAFFSRFVYFFTEFPLGYNILKWFVYGYGGSIFGAWILDQNPAFKKEAEIKHIFSTLGYIDSNGDPWKITWTPDAVMITAFNCDPNALSQNTRFWSSINFPPSTPKIFKDNMNKFIVMRKYELPQELTFELKD